MVKARNSKVSAAKAMRLHRLYLVNPQEDASMDELAEKIVSLRSIQEMFLEDDSNGFLVKVRFFPGCEPKDIAGYLSSRLSREFGRVATG